MKTPAAHPQGRRAARGFSLLELMVVMGVAVILMLVAMPTVTQTLRATKLTTTGQAVMDQLNLARQAAMSRNVPVEVRFYKLAGYNETAPGAPSIYRAMQSYSILPEGPTPLAKATYFASPIIVSPGVAESPFLSSTTHPEQAAPTGVAVPGYGTTYKYTSFQFAPDGSADLTNAENSFTLVLQGDKALTQGANFFVVQVNPINGSVRSFRP